MAHKDAQLARDVVLALITHHPTHGWAIKEQLSPEGDLGQAWSLSKQLVYRAIDSLDDSGLVRRAQPKDGGGADRVIITATAAGKRATTEWLNAPVQHLRDVRTELVVKLMMRERFELPMSEFLLRQRAVFEPMINAIEKAPSTTAVSLWRKESASSVRRFLARLEN